jgi:hypothetical protein
MPLEHRRDGEQAKKLDMLAHKLKGKRAEVALRGGSFVGMMTEVVREGRNVFYTITDDDNADHTLTFPISERSDIELYGLVGNENEAIVDNRGDRGAMRVRLS